MHTGKRTSHVGLSEDEDPNMLKPEKNKHGFSLETFYCVISITGNFFLPGMLTKSRI